MTSPNPIRCQEHNLFLCPFCPETAPGVAATPESAAPRLTIKLPPPTKVFRAEAAPAVATTPVPAAKPAPAVLPWQQQIRSIFEIGDLLHIKLIHSTRTWTDKKGNVNQEMKEHWLVYDGDDAEFYGKLKDCERDGWNIFICIAVFDLAKLRPILDNGSKQPRRIADNIATVDGQHVIRTVAVECDENGEASLSKIREAVGAGIVPAPTLIIRSSTPEPGSSGVAKYHLWWAVKGFTLPQQEAVNFALQKAFDGDVKAKDTVRVLRLAGFANQKKKYSHKPVVSIVETSTGRYTFDQFKLPVEVSSVDNAARPKASSDYIEFVSAQIEENAATAGFDLGTVSPWKETGFKWVQKECPNADAHESGGRSGSCVMVMPSGARDFTCLHTHCAHLDWAWFKNHLNELVGESLDWTDKNAVKTPETDGDTSHETEVEPTDDMKITSLLVFKTAEDAALATKLGFHSLSAPDFKTPLDPAFDRVVLCGRWDASFQKINAVIPGTGAIGTGLPFDDSKPMIDHGSYAMRPTFEHLTDMPANKVPAYLESVLTLHGVLKASVKKPRTRPVDVPVDSHIEVIDNSERTEQSQMEMISEMPQSALASTRLGDIYADLFEPNDFPLDLALPALVTAASVLVPRLVETPDSTIILGDDNMVNLYTALISKAGGGKSQVTEWAAKILNIFSLPCGEHYMEGKWGSAEQMFRYLKMRQTKFVNSVLINPDELAHLFAKAGIPNASFATILTTSYYRRRQTITIAKGVELNINLGLSIIGGIVDDQFGTVLNSATIGGLYDRMMFGETAPGYQWAYRDYPRPLSNAPLDPLPVAVSSDGSVTEVEKAWRKEDSGLGRIVEVCIRIAKIYASMDGRAIVTGRDLETLKGLAMRQKTIREIRQPNAGETPDAIFSNAVTAWLRVHTKGEWVLISTLKDGVHCYEMKLGPNVAERALQAMARGDRIDLWTPKPDKDGNKPPLPKDYNGTYPRLGLVRLNAKNLS